MRKFMRSTSEYWGIWLFRTRPLYSILAWRFDECTGKWSEKRLSTRAISWAESCFHYSFNETNGRLGVLITGIVCCSFQCYVKTSKFTEQFQSKRQHKGSEISSVTPQGIIMTQFLWNLLEIQMKSFWCYIITLPKMNHLHLQSNKLIFYQ